MLLYYHIRSEAFASIGCPIVVHLIQPSRTTHSHLLNMPKSKSSRASSPEGPSPAKVNKAGSLLSETLAEFAAANHELSTSVKDLVANAITEKEDRERERQELVDNRPTQNVINTDPRILQLLESHATIMKELHERNGVSTAPATPSTTSATTTNSTIAGSKHPTQSIRP